jgi:hypothetical protein
LIESQTIVTQFGTESPVIDMLSPEEEKLVALAASIIVDKTIKQAYEESNTIPAFQQ